MIFGNVVGIWVFGVVVFFLDVFICIIKGFFVKLWCFSCVFYVVCFLSLLVRVVCNKFFEVFVFLCLFFLIGLSIVICIDFCFGGFDKLCKVRFKCLFLMYLGICI